jgi:2-methylcitrate dehydratase PrpD
MVNVPVAMSATSITARLAGFVAPLRYQDLPDDVRKLAGLLLMDALGCGLVGSSTPEANKLRRSASALGGGSGDTVIWGTNERAPLPLAVMANSVSVHCRELDDISLAYHAGSVVVPAAVCTAAAVGASGSDLITAIAAGYEASFRVAAGGAPKNVPGFLPFKNVGWHSTSLFGPFGAATAAGKLLGLDEEHLRWTLGIAGSSASGTWAFIGEGNTNKRVHPGLASKSGVTAAFLAREGITGPSQILEAEWGGFYRTYLHGAPFFPEHAAGELGSRWEIRHAGFKPYASCRRIHSSLDAVFAAMKKHDLKPEQVRRITIWGNSIHTRQLSKFPVSTVLEAQFSLQYTVAAALLTGTAGLDQYSEAALRRPEITPLAQRVDVKLDPSLWDHGEPRLEFELADGRVLSETVSVPRGHPDNPLTGDELARKFRGNAGLVFGESQVQALQSAIENVDRLPNVKQLVALLTPGPNPTRDVD